MPRKYCLKVQEQSEFRVVGLTGVKREEWKRRKLYKSMGWPQARSGKVARGNNTGEDIV